MSEKKSRFIPEIPYETLVRDVCSPQWRNLSEPEIDGAWGVAIVKSILDGVRPDISQISSHLGIERRMLQHAFRRLDLNGIFRSNQIYADRKALESNDLLAWCYYAGYAQGAVGSWMEKER